MTEAQKAAIAAQLQAIRAALDSLELQVLASAESAESDERDEQPALSMATMDGEPMTMVGG